MSRRKLRKGKRLHGYGSATEGLAQKSQRRKVVATERGRCVPKKRGADGKESQERSKGKGRKNPEHSAKEAVQETDTGERARKA